MWDWDTTSPNDLEELSLAVARINFNIRYPRSVADLAEMMMQKGGYIGRLGMSMLRGNPVAEELMPALKLREKTSKDS